ncbi:MAG: tetratricopeptide repeat protein [Coriobacteriia bacterium]
MAQDIRPGSSVRVRARSDRTLDVVIALLVVLVLSVGGYLGWTVYVERRADRLSSPAMRAIDDLTARVKAAPRDAALRVRLGEALASAQLLPDAVEQLRVAVKIDVKHTGAYLDLGLIAYDQKQPKVAAGYFKKVVDLTEGADYANVNQRRELALYYLGSIALADRRYEEAAGYFKAAIRIRRDASDSYYNLALALRGLGRDGEAIEQLGAALAFDPNYAQAHLLLGELYKRTGDDILSATHVREAARLAPDADPPAEALEAFGTPAEWLAKGRAALAAGDLKTAEKAARMAKALDPLSAAPHALLGAVLERQGDKAGALTAWREAAKLAPKDAAAAAAVRRLTPKRRG